MKSKKKKRLKSKPETVIASKARRSTEDFLLEIGCEELPSAFLVQIKKELPSIFSSELQKERIGHNPKDIKVMVTPRRIVLSLLRISIRQKDLIIRNFGPPVKAAFDDKGRPTQAALGFAKSQSVEPESLKIEKRGDRECVLVQKLEKGKKAIEVLPSVVSSVVKSIKYKKTMRWITGDGQSFPRPIRWILALFGSEVVKGSVGNIKFGTHTFGHRLLSKGPIKVESADINKFKSLLKKQNVIIDDEERYSKIKDDICKIRREKGGLDIIEPGEVGDAGLLQEVVNLVEYPVVICDEFDQKYLSLPQELLVACMMEHDRFFPVFSSAGHKIMPYFISVGNNPKGIPALRAGNKSVISAKLADAKFFYEEDLRQSTDKRIERTKHIIFQESMGSLYDKTQRVAKLAESIASSMKLTGTEKENLRRAAALSKCDAGSQVVTEFPSLQGVMGRIYAEKSGENTEVSDAVYEHHLPRFTGDNLPSSRVGMVLSIADKMDTLVAFLSSGYTPTGGGDPYGLRRCAYAIVGIITKKKLSLSLRDIIGRSLDIMGASQTEKTGDAIYSFFKERMKAVFEEKSLRYDEFDALLGYAFEDFNRAIDCAGSIRSFRENPEFKKLITAFKRVVNILQQAGDISSRPFSGALFLEKKRRFDEGFLKENDEKELCRIFLNVKDDIKGNIDSQRFGDALQKIVSNLSKPVDKFFDNVMVMDKDEALRNNRLALLAEIAELFFSMADFSKIVVSGS